MLTRISETVGPLRLALGVITLILVGFSPFSSGPVDTSSVRIVPTLVVPTVVPMLFFVLVLDMLMARLFMIDKRGHERQRFRRILWLEAGFLALLLLAWWPFFSRLLTR